MTDILTITEEELAAANPGQIEVQPNFVFPEDSEIRQPVVLYIDPSKLAKYRSVYADPELLHESLTDTGEIPMSAFFAVGGIPAEAIIHATEEFDPDLF